jgi:predicted ATPase
MEGKRKIKKLSIRNFLSFGGQQEIELQPLNVLIGPNASGKSNLIEAFRVLNAAPEDIGTPIRKGGGIDEYVWKGSFSQSEFGLGVLVNKEAQGADIFYGIGVARDGLGLKIAGEVIQYAEDGNDHTQDIYKMNGRNRGTLYSLKVTLDNSTSTIHPEYERSDINVQSEKPILSQIKDPSRYPALTYLQETFLSISFYAGWDMGHLRSPQRADLPSTTLLEDGSNIGLSLINKPASLRQQISERLKIVLPTVEEIFPKVEGGTVPLYIREKGFTTPTPASRLSEGTLRYLCLLTLLLDPTPPPIICLEEPEAGLHPHVIPQIAELLIDASQRTQLIVTTHSDELISGLSDCPEAIIVCERDDDGTKLRRLEPAQIKPWLDRYAIGDLWRMGEIGGVR